MKNLKSWNQFNESVDDVPDMSTERERIIQYIVDEQDNINPALLSNIKQDILIDGGDLATALRNVDDHKLVEIYREMMNDVYVDEVDALDAINNEDEEEILHKKEPDTE